MAEAFSVSTEEYHDIFGTSDEESDTVNSEGSDIDVQEVESDQEEDQNDGEGNNDSNASDTVEWSNELEDFDINEFSGRPGIKFNVPGYEPFQSAIRRLSCRINCDGDESICTSKAGKFAASQKVEGHNKS